MFGSTILTLALLGNAVAGHSSQSAKRASGSWTDAYAKANAAIAKLSNTDKASIVTGVGWKNGPCMGNTALVSSIGYSFCVQDGPLG